MTYTEQMKAILAKAGGSTDSNLYSEILLAILDALSTSSGSGVDEQTLADIAENTKARHTHTNKTALNKITQSDIDNLKALLAVDYYTPDGETYKIIDDSGASPIFEQLSGQIGSMSYTLSDISERLSKVPQKDALTAMVAGGMDGVETSYIPVWTDSSNSYYLRSGVWRMWGSGKTVTTDVEFDIGGGISGGYEVVVESLDSSTKSLNTMIFTDGKFKFSNNIALGTSGVMIYMIED